MLPGLDGLEVCRRIQHDRPVPVLMLTARDSETDLLVGLAVGADDYLTKPFSARELTARVHALLRRVDRGRGRAPTTDCSASATSRSTSPAAGCDAAGELVHLTPTEFDLLVHLVKRPGGSPPASSSSPRCGATATARAPAPSTRTCGRCGASSATTSSAPCTASDTRPSTRSTPGARRSAASTGRVSQRFPLDVDMRDLDLRHPLNPLPSIKMKLGFILVVAVAVTVFVFWLGIHVGIWPSVSGVIAGGVAMAIVWWLSRGLTSPLRAMAEAADAMAKGDYSRRVAAPSRDEVGQLARAFNEMAAELAETDRVRRDLVANVSHELRTPITALQAALENLVDGVAAPDPETFATMLAQVERLGRLVKQLLDLSRLEVGHRPPRPVRSSRSSRSSSSRCASSVCTNRRSRSTCRSTRPGSPPTATPSACIRSSPTCSRTRSASPPRAAPSRYGPAATSAA